MQVRDERRRPSMPNTRLAVLTAGVPPHASTPLFDVPTVVLGLTPFNMGGPDEYVLVDELLAVAKIHTLVAYEHAEPMRASMSRERFWWPFSIRLIALWLVRSSSASCCWVQPRCLRASRMRAPIRLR